MPSPALVRSLRGAVSFVNRAGIALTFSAADVVLPSLWEAIAGPGPLEWAVRDEDGKFESFTPEMQKLWRWKDELPEKKLVCVGRYIKSHSCLISLELLPSFYAQTGRRGRPGDHRSVETLSPLEKEVAEAISEQGPSSAPEVRKLLNADKKSVDKAVTALQKQFVLTHAGANTKGPGWAATNFDLLTRRFGDALSNLPDAETGRRQIAAKVMSSATELSAADLAAALAWKRSDATAILQSLEDEGVAARATDGRFPIWKPRRKKAGQLRH